MKKNATAFSSEQVRHLRDDLLSFSAQLSAEHYNDIALCFVDGRTHGFKRACLNAQLSSGERFVCRISESQRSGVLCSGSYVNELRRSFAQTNRDAIDENEFRATVPHGLANLLSG